MNAVDPQSLDWTKSGGLMPAVVQDADTRTVLMVAWMNPESLRLTQSDGFATFYSRSRQRLWRKGESSGNTITVVDVRTDCDRDTLLILGRPTGSVCHTGAANCFESPIAATPHAFLSTLEGIIDQRIGTGDGQSYTARTHAQGLSRIAQKVGEEGLEVALAAVQKDRAGLIGESADLVFHLLLLLRAEGLSLADVCEELSARHTSRG